MDGCSQELFSPKSILIEGFDQKIHYGLKDITKLDDFNQVVDWENRSIYKASDLLSNCMI